MKWVDSLCSHWVAHRSASAQTEDTHQRENGAKIQFVKNIAPHSSHHPIHSDLSTESSSDCLFRCSPYRFSAPSHPGAVVRPGAQHDV